MKERRRERVSERGRKHRSSEGHGSLVLAKKTVLNTCSCLLRPFNLLITCQSITRQPDQMSAAARPGAGREGERKTGKGGQIACLGEQKMKGEVDGAAACLY